MLKDYIVLLLFIVMNSSSYLRNTQVCKDIHDMKLRQLLVTQVHEQEDDNLFNQSDHKDTLCLNRNKSDPPDIHGACVRGAAYDLLAPVV